MSPSQDTAQCRMQNCYYLALQDGQYVLPNELVFLYFVLLTLQLAQCWEGRLQNVEGKKLKKQTDKNIDCFGGGGGGGDFFKGLSTLPHGEALTGTR